MKCWLKNLKAELPSIELKDKIKLPIGRTAATKVKDPKVSRVQGDY
jgi:hypothetical protein